MTWRLYSLSITFISVLLLIGLLACYRNKGWLTIENASYLATIGGTVIGAITLISIAVQLRQQTKLARAANSQSFLDKSSTFTLSLLEDNGLLSLWRDGGMNYSSLSSENQSKYKHLLSWWLTFYENMYYQNKCGFLDTNVFAAWDNDVNNFVVRRNLRMAWDELKDSYDPEFVQYVEAKFPTAPV